MGDNTTPETPLPGPCRLLQEELPWRAEPEQVALWLRGAERPFALIGRWAGGGALIGSEPVAVAPAEADPFALLEAQPEVEGPAAAAGGGDAGAGEDAAGEGAAADGAAQGRRPTPVGGGWFGYLGYRLGSNIERLDPAPWGGPELPAFSLAFYDNLLRQDAHGRWWFEALVTPAREAAILARLARFQQGPAGADRRPFRTAPWRQQPGPAGHSRAVAACRERIFAGDLFQANICGRLSSRLDGDPLDLFAAAVPRLAPDRAAYMAGPWGAVVSLSPELFLERKGRKVRTAPIKGTRPRPGEGDSLAAQEELAELRGSGKDRAENQMILDLARNDLGRVCLYGTIEVEAVAEARPHTGVWHLVSEVAGELHPDLGDRALLRATFPPASVTGAPKIAAQNVIAELESSPRQVYTGSIGFVSPVAGMELSVAIRTLEIAPDGEAWLGVGGGIVADSDPAAEAEECLTKARPLLEAIGARLEQDRRATVGKRVPQPLRLGPRPVPRPDPGAGVFETIRLEDGEPQILDLHLRRLGQSVRELYRAELPGDLAGRIEAAAREFQGRSGASGAPRGDRAPGAGGGGSDLGRLRVVARPGGAEGLTVTITTAALAEREPPTLRPICLPGGLGPHKWADRRLVDALSAAVAPDLPLFCDLDGYLLEAAHSALFAELGEGGLVTPPLDGRILPSVSRSRVLAERAASERPLHLAELGAASGIYICNALYSLTRVDCRL